MAKSKRSIGGKTLVKRKMLVLAPSDATSVIHLCCYSVRMTPLEATEHLKFFGRNEQSSYRSSVLRESNKAFYQIYNNTYTRHVDNNVEPHMPGVKGTPVFGSHKLPPTNGVTVNSLACAAVIVFTPFHLTLFLVDDPGPVFRYSE